MLNNNLFFYEIDGLYVITPNNDSNCKNLKEIPMNVFKDQIKLAVAYIRWSDDFQTDRHSLSIQETQIIAKARALKYKVIVLFIEEATSAYHRSALKRKKMVELMECVLSNPNADAIFFLNDSRATRGIIDFTVDILNPIRKVRPHFKVYSTDIEGEWDENNPFSQMKLAMHRQESENKSNDARKYHDSIFNSGNRPDGRRPFGFEKGEDGLVSNDYIYVVVLIFYLYSFGESEEQIANLLNEAKILTPTFILDMNKEKVVDKRIISYEWNPSSIRYILTNPYYAGHLAWFVRESYHNSTKKTPDRIEHYLSNNHKPIIPENLWGLTNYLRTIKRSKSQMASNFVLRDIIYCAVCNEKLKTKNNTPPGSSKNYLLYHCPSCKNKVNATKVHQVVKGHFVKRWSKPLSDHIKDFQSMIVTWRNKLLEQKNKVKEQLSIIKYNQSMLNSKDVEIDIKALSEMYHNQIAFKNKILEELNLLMDQLDEFRKQDQTELLGRFTQNIELYKNQELKSILLQAINDIQITIFSKEDFELIINYRLTPYIDMENKINSVVNIY